MTDYRYHADTVQGLLHTYPMDGVRLYMLDDGLIYNPQTDTGHPAYTGQISKDSRWIYRRLEEPNADSTTIDQNTWHGSLA